MMKQRALRPTDCKVGQWFSHWREASQLNQSQMAKRLLVRQSTISRIEAGKQAADFDTIRGAITVFTDCMKEQLFEAETAD